MNIIISSKNVSPCIQEIRIYCRSCRFAHSPEQDKNEKLNFKVGFISTFKSSFDGSVPTFTQLLKIKNDKLIIFIPNYNNFFISKIPVKHWITEVT